MGKVRECDGRSGSEPVVSIIAAGMGVLGDCGVPGALRVGPSAQRNFPLLWILL